MASFSHLRPFHRTRHRFGPCDPPTASGSVSASIENYEEHCTTPSDEHSSLLSRITTSTTDGSAVDIDENPLSGIGLSSGRVIYAIGQAEINAVRWLLTRHRRSTNHSRDSREGSTQLSQLSVNPFHRSHEHDDSQSYISTDTISTSDAYVDDNALSGIGLTSGNVLYAVGKAQIGAVQWLWIRYRRTVINWTLTRDVGHFKRGTEIVFDDLVEFGQVDAPGYSLELGDWALQHLIEEFRSSSSSSHSVVMALHRAPSMVRLQTLYGLYSEMCLLAAEENRSPEELSESWSTLAPLAQELLTDVDWQVGTGVGQALDDPLAFISVVWSGDATRSWQMLRPRLLSLYVQDVIIAQQQHTMVFPPAALSPFLQTSKSVLGSDHPVNVSFEYLINQDHSGLHEDALSGCALDAYIRMSSEYLCQSLICVTDTQLRDHLEVVGRLALKCEQQERWVEAEVFWRLLVRAQVHASRNVFKLAGVHGLLTDLSRVLRQQRRQEEAELCDSLSRLAKDEPKKVGLFARAKLFRKLRQRRKSVPRHPATLSADEWYQLWITWNQTNDAFVRRISSHLDEERRELVFHYLGLDAGDEADFYTAHECSSDCKHGKTDEESSDEDEDGDSEGDYYSTFERSDQCEHDDAFVDAVKDENDVSFVVEQPERDRATRHQAGLEEEQ